MGLWEDVKYTLLKPLEEFVDNRWVVMMRKYKELSFELKEKQALEKQNEDMWFRLKEMSDLNQRVIKLLEKGEK